MALLFNFIRTLKKMLKCLLQLSLVMPTKLSNILLMEIVRTGFMQKEVRNNESQKDITSMSIEIGNED